jgi:hypothetical protein
MTLREVALLLGAANPIPSSWLVLGGAAFGLLRQVVLRGR